MEQSLRIYIKHATHINILIFISLARKLLYDLAIPLLGIYPEKTIIKKDVCAPVLIAALFAIAITWKQPRHPLADEWIKKLCIQCIKGYHSGNLAVH